MLASDIKRHDNGIWYVHWSEGRRSKRQSTRTSDPDAAQKFLIAWQWEAAGRHSSSGHPDTVPEEHEKSDGMTCREIWQAYYTEHLQPRTVSQKRGHDAWAHLAHMFAERRPQQVTQTRLYAYETARMSGQIGRPARRATVWQEVNYMATSWNFAIRTGRLRPEMRAKIIFPGFFPPRDRWLKDDEVERFLASVVGFRGSGGRLSRVERFAWIALETGARKRVIETLTWDQVDLEARVIHYSRATDHRTLKRKPSVPISDTLLPLLEQAYAERAGSYVLDRPVVISYEFKVAAARAKIDGLTPNVLRHTAATWMARRGVSFWQIAGVLGNSVGMVEKVYAKHCPTGLAEAVAKISGGSRRKLTWVR